MSLKQPCPSTATVYVMMFKKSKGSFLNPSVNSNYTYIGFFKFYKYGNKEMVIGLLLHILILNQIETVMAGMESKIL